MTTGQVAINQGQARSVPAGSLPCEGAKVIPVSIDFSINATWELDLSQLTQQGWISGIQAIFVDNSANGQAVKIITNTTTNQTLIVPANKQAYLPILQTNPPQFAITSTGNVAIMVHLLNFYVAPAVWG